MKRKFIYIFSLLIANVTLGQELYSFVDTKIGSKNNGLESGYTFIGSTYPFGMVQFTPSFFSPNKGFVITQLNGAGCANMGNFPVLPISKEVIKAPNKMDSYQQYDRVIISEAGLLSVVMNDNTEVKLTTSKRAGYANFIFNNSSKKGSVLIGSGINSTEVTESYVKITSNKTAEGFAKGGDFCGTQTDYKIYFVIEFDRPSIYQKTWKSNTITNDSKTDGKNSGSLFVFNTEINKEVNYKISISYVSIKNAKLNMISESSGFDFKSVLENNQNEWNKNLSQISTILLKFLQKSNSSKSRQ